MFLFKHKLGHFLEKLGSSVGLFLETIDFCTDVFKAYNELVKSISVDKVDEMLNEPIFCNENIKIDNEVVFYRKWFDKGIYAIRYVIEKNGNFLSCQAFTHKFNLNINFVSYMGCMQVIMKYINAGHLNLTDETDYHHDFHKSLQIIYSVKKGTLL